MDDRDMEEEGKNRKRKGWGTEIKITIYFLISDFYVFYYVIRNPKAHRTNKVYY
jgi:hypothetical protein